MEFQRGDKMSQIEQFQASIDRSNRQIGFITARLEEIKTNLGIPDNIFDELKYNFKLLEFWSSNIELMENQVCEQLRLEAVYPPPTGE